MGNRLIEENYKQTIGLARQIMAENVEDIETFTGEPMNMGAKEGEPLPEPPKRLTWDEAMAEAQRLMTEGPRLAPADEAPQTAPPVARRPR